MAKKQPDNKGPNVPPGWTVDPSIWVTPPASYAWCPANACGGNRTKEYFILEHKDGFRIWDDACGRVVLGPLDTFEAAYTAFNVTYADKLGGG